jgi:hypothetical protein
LHAQAQETKSCGDQHGLSGRKARFDDDDGERVRQDVPTHDSDIGRPDGARRFDIVLGLELENAAAHQARHWRHERDGYGKDEAEKARTDDAGNGDRQHQGGNGKQEIDESGNRRRRATFEVAGGNAESDTGNECRRDRDERGGQGEPRADDDARKDVASQ